MWLIYLTVKQRSTLAKNNVIFQDVQGVDLYKILEKYLEEVKDVQLFSKRIEKEMHILGEHVERSFQKIGFERYNPFGTESAGNQSFSIAILDLQNSGFVITGLHSREGTRVYAKSVIAGKANHHLSKEEEIVLKKAVNKESKNVREKR